MVTNPHDEVSRFYNRLFAFPCHYDQELVTALGTILSKTGARSVIDLGCGSGNPSIGLAKAGYQVTAVDTSVEMLNLARTNASSVGAELEFQNCRMEGVFGWGIRYDLVLCHDSIYHFRNLSEFRAFFAKVKERLLVQNGCLYIATKRWSVLTGREDRQRLELRGVVSCGDRRNLIVFDVCENDLLTVFVIEEDEARTHETSIVFPWFPKNPAIIKTVLLDTGFGCVQMVNEREEDKYNCIGIMAR